MQTLMEPWEFWVLLVVVLTGAGAVGISLRRRWPKMVAEDHEDQFTGVQASVLALLGLLVGFSFSMAVGRYQDRKKAEVEEANAIATSWLRIDTVGQGADALRERMREYVQTRTEFYDAGSDDEALGRALEHRSAAQARLWNAAVTGTVRDPMVNVYFGTLTEVFDSAERRQASFENRIPLMAWLLLLLVAVCACFLVGMGIWRWNLLLLAVLPFVVASTLTLIYDLDTPQNGMIRVGHGSMDRVAQQIGVRR